MGIHKHPGEFKLRIVFFLICFFLFFFFFFKANMTDLTVFAGILLAVTMATARRASLGEKTMQAAGKADEPGEAMREAARPASLVEKVMRAADEAEEPVEAKRYFSGCETPCSRLLSPVCGSNGKTYDNMCLFEIAACRAKKKGQLLTSVEGSCKFFCERWKENQCGEASEYDFDANMMLEAPCYKGHRVGCRKRKCWRDCEYKAAEGWMVFRNYVNKRSWAYVEQDNEAIRCTKNEDCIKKGAAEMDLEKKCGPAVLLAGELKNKNV